MQSVHTKLTVMLMLAGLVLTCPAGFQAFGSDSEIARSSLRGLQGVEVLVEYIDQEVERDGSVWGQVQTDVELRLRKAGIRVRTKEESGATSGYPSLYISINAHRFSDRPVYAYNLTVELHQAVWLARDPSIKAYGATTWSVGGIESVGQGKVRQVREHVIDFIDQFINAYLAVNPEQAGAGKHSRREENSVPDASIIRAVQWQLQEAGFDPGPVDGKIGTQTRLALRQYQPRQGLPTTGELDEKTRRALGLK